MALDAERKDMKLARIADLSVYLPENTITNQDLESRLNAHRQILPVGALERLFGIRERRYASANEQVSDLAAFAALPVVERVGVQNIDFLIFAAACSDMIEPATCNMVQHKLGLRCPAIDVKNACNSFTSGLMLASNLVSGGTYRHVLVVNGEKLSDAVRFDVGDDQLARHLAAYSFGDAGAAALVALSEDESGFYFQKFMTDGSHWQLCTIPGGGSLFPHEPDKYYFEGHTSALKEVMADTGTDFFHRCMAEAGWKTSELQHFFTHQISVETQRLIQHRSGVDTDCMEDTFTCFGNTAAASIPLAMVQRLNQGKMKKGDKVALLGLAAGISVSVQLLVW